MDELRPYLERLAALTGRERQVLALRAAGRSVAEIAAALVVEPRTVTFHLGNIYAKLGIAQPSQAARQLALVPYGRALAHLAHLDPGGTGALEAPGRQRRRRAAPMIHMTEAAAVPVGADGAPAAPAGGPGLPVPFAPVLTAAVGHPGGRGLDAYRARGGYRALRRALTELSPEEVIRTVTESKLVGRGGGGFPTGDKWAWTARNPAPRYLVVNADESEPGTFGNRYAMDADPHMLLEGMLICCYAVGIEKAH
ncbi:MAG TPA: LuxR C-terminal-related transcriptional regulator, partial [Chloroflexota bacterium]|nr:LuxR C-terminal-related transcriptional regulator [Chloroflexota bacterium]